MILPKSHRLTAGQLAEITQIVTEFGCKIQPIVGAVRTIYEQALAPAALADTVAQARQLWALRHSIKTA